MLPYYGVSSVTFVQPIFKTIVLNVTVPAWLVGSTDIDLFVVPVVPTDACVTVNTAHF